MKTAEKFFAAIILSLLFSSVSPAVEQKPETIAEKMSFKLVRGVTNIFTSPVEIPKQIILTVRNHGAVGYITGPVKGFGMMFYRGAMGIAETLLFTVPQPGYYEPMTDPEFVWNDWSSSRNPSITSDQQKADRTLTKENLNDSK